jgi:hypothetical protein
LSDVMMGAVAGSGLSGRSEVVWRIPGDVADSREPGESDDHRSSSARAVASGRMAGYLWPPTARSTAGEDFSLAGSTRKRGLRWDSLRSPFSAKILSAGCLAALALCPRSRLRLGLVAPAVTDIAAWRKPQNMLVQTNRAGGALRFRFRLSSVNTTVACQVM